MWLHAAAFRAVIGSKLRREAEAQIDLSIFTALPHTACDDVIWYYSLINIQSYQRLAQYCRELGSVSLSRGAPFHPAVRDKPGLATKLTTTKGKVVVNFGNNVGPLRTSPLPRWTCLSSSTDNVSHVDSINLRSFLSSSVQMLHGRPTPRPGKLSRLQRLEHLFCSPTLLTR